MSVAATTVTATTTTDAAKQLDQTMAKIQDVTKLVSALSQAVSTPLLPDDSDKLTPDVVKGCWPGVSINNVSQNLPLIKTALKEYGLTDKPMLIAAMAVVRINSENFAPFTETQNHSNTHGSIPFDAYENRADLGNTEPGDGARFIGRGFVGLTGKNNYKDYGQQLGIDLLKTPDTANHPDVAARILAAYLKRYSGPMRSAILAGDYARALRLITGGTSDLPAFESMAKCIATKL